MIDECFLTAEIWASRLGGNQDNGDGIGSGLANWASSLCNRPTESQLTIFKATLAEGLMNKIIDSHAWNPEDPKFGSYCRCLQVDYGAERVLSDAIEESGIESELLPIKSRTQTNFGYVSCWFGYSAKEERIYVQNVPLMFHKKQ
ncbi:MAG: hypothetical protein H7Y07_08035 [Pyrinomonadaceae bacterium]|nr:hypothetical protein [Sphingobacteriaceae bacterium]